MRAVLLLVVGCTPPGADAETVDAPPMGSAAPKDITLAQTDTMLDPTGGLGCWTCLDTGHPCGGYTEESSFYRVFDLAQYGVTTSFHASQVMFGVARSVGVQTLTVKLGTYAGGFDKLDVAAMTTLATAMVDIPPLTNQKLISVPIAADVPAHSRLVVEVFSPSHKDQGKIGLSVGTTNRGETHPGWMRAPLCKIPTPETTAEIGLPELSLVMTVTGTY